MDKVAKRLKTIAWQLIVLSEMTGKPETADIPVPLLGACVMTATKGWEDPPSVLEPFFAVDPKRMTRLFFYDNLVDEEKFSKTESDLLDRIVSAVRASKAFVLDSRSVIFACKADIELGAPSFLRDEIKAIIARVENEIYIRTVAICQAEEILKRSPHTL